MIVLGAVITLIVLTSLVHIITRISRALTERTLCETDRNGTGIYVGSIEIGRNAAVRFIESDIDEVVNEYMYKRK